MTWTSIQYYCPLILDLPSCIIVTDTLIYGARYQQGNLSFSVNFVYFDTKYQLLTKRMRYNFNGCLQVPICKISYNMARYGKIFHDMGKIVHDMARHTGAG